MPGCEWLVGWLVVASGQGLATDRQTGSGFLVSAGELNHILLSSVRGCFCDCDECARTDHGPNDDVCGIFVIAPSATPTI